MNIIMAAADLLFDVDVYRRTVAQLDAVTAERDAALQRVAALEEQLQAMTQNSAFYFDMITAQDAWQRAQRERERRHDAR